MRQEWPTQKKEAGDVRVGNRVIGRKGKPKQGQRVASPLNENAPRVENQEDTWGGFGRNEVEKA